VIKKIWQKMKKRPSKKQSTESTKASRSGSLGTDSRKRLGSKPVKLGKVISDRLNEFADALESGADVRAKFTCRRVVLNLEPQPYDPRLVKNTRAILSVSQGIFAQFLGVSIDTVQAWESGVNTPSDMACRFMDEIRHNPEYWQKRLSESISRKVETAGA
jgi:putative transcriptional regulator